MRLCIVSPHLDDAVLSCGVRMQRARAAGDDVLVLNIFTAGTNAANRRIEDEAAVSVLGGRCMFLDELDAPDRDPLYQSDIQLFHGDFAAVPQDFIAHTATRLGEVLDAEKIDEMILPLAAGTHIDHRIAFSAGRQAAASRKNLNVRYYEDRPYVLWPGMLQARLNQLACDAGLAPIAPEDMLASIDKYHYLTHFVPPGEFRDVCLPRYFADLTPPTAFKMRGKMSELVATQEETAKLYESLACYTSQMPYIYPDLQTFLHDSDAHEKARTGRRVYAERSWELISV